MTRMLIAFSLVLMGCGKKQESSFSLQNADWLKLNVTFNMKISKKFNSPKQLIGVISRVQEIYNQAKIELVPRFDTKNRASKYCDVVIRPRFPYFGQSENGNANPYASREMSEIDVNEEPWDHGVKARKGVPVPKYLRNLTNKTKVDVTKLESSLGHTSAHEIGHMLWLPHTSDKKRLMYSGGSGELLTAAEIKKMRSFVNRYK